MRLQNQVAIITGAVGGIGFAATKRFLEEGATVIMADFNEEEGVAKEKQLKEAGYPVMFYPVEVASFKDMEKLAREVAEKFGKIDILINNAGITRDAMLTKMGGEQFQQVLDVNITGVFNCTKAVAPMMIQQGKGRIINTSSVSGVYGNIGQTNYAASKAAVIGMTKTWAKELGRKGIRVNAVVPGFIETEMVKTMPEEIIARMKNMIPLGRLGRPEDVAHVYLFLASPEGDYINGAVLHVDGGIIM